MLNLTSVEQADAVNRLARLTGAQELPELKQRLGYAYEPRKLEVAGLTPIMSETVAAPRALECPIQLEAVVAARHGVMDDDPQVAGLISAFEVRITRVHVHPSLLMEGYENRIDPAKWRPLIMNFQKLYGVSNVEVVTSRLAEINEKTYRIGGDAEYEALVARVVGLVEAPGLGLDLPLDVRGTVFQQRVWRTLREIPAGETVSYAEVALRVGSPTAVRAVAGACAANNLAVAIPCHRVVKTNGALSGYAWGVERKRAFLEREKAA